jgi:hypothetical protein
MFGIDDAALTEVAIAVAEALLRVGSRLLRGDPENKAFKTALGEALRDLKGQHPDWYAGFFDSGFLKGKGASVLAKAIMRDGPTATELARAYESDLSSVKLAPQWFKEAERVAADFLLRLDIALRARPEFRAHFDSRALDSALRYLTALLELAQASWAIDRQKLVDEYLGMFITAIETYRLLGEALAADQQLRPLDQLDARVSIRKAVFGLTRIKYFECGPLRDSFVRLVADRYSDVQDARGSIPSMRIALLNLQQGCDEMSTLLYAAPPL